MAARPREGERKGEREGERREMEIWGRTRGGEKEDKEQGRDVLEIKIEKDGERRRYGEGGEMEIWGEGEGGGGVVKKRIKSGLPVAGKRMDRGTGSTRAAKMKTGRERNEVEIVGVTEERESEEERREKVRYRGEGKKRERESMK